MPFKDSLSRIEIRFRQLLPAARKATPSRKPKQGLTVFWSICIAVLLWFSFKMNATYQQVMQIPVKLVNIPPGKVSEQVLPKRVKLEVSGNGWQLRQLYAQMPEMQLNAAQVDKNGNLKLRQFLPPSQQFGGQVEYKSLSPEELNLVFGNRTYKWVPVRLNGRLGYANSYAALTEHPVTPRQIQISGVAKWVNQVEYVETEPIDLVNIYQSFERELRILNPYPEQIELEHPSVKLQVQVAQFTEEVQRVRVKTTGLPPEIRALVLEPATVEVIYRVPLQDYGKLSANHFQVVVDYRAILEDNLLQWVKPTLKPIQSPLPLKDIRIRPTYLKYRIKVKPS